MSVPRVSVIGAGGWGTALGLLLAGRGMEVSIWGHDAAHVEAIRATRCNEKYLSGVALPETIRPTTDLALCVQADILLIAVPSKYLGAVAGRIAKASDADRDRPPGACFLHEGH